VLQIQSTQQSKLFKKMSAVLPSSVGKQRRELKRVQVLDEITGKISLIVITSSFQLAEIHFVIPVFERAHMLSGNASSSFKQ